jgi:hypothetical protein
VQEVPLGGGGSIAVGATGAGGGTTNFSASGGGQGTTAATQP